ncbi:MAG: TonB-dependent receptor [Acidobacteria bacterium]|nr:TonB-dependent receptor [Acidobacteriota bacterium]
MTATWTWTMTSSIVSEAKFQYGRDFESQIPNASGPQFQITGGADFGMPNFLPRGAFPNEKQFQWQENLSWLKGRHQFKAGFDVRHVRDNIQNLFQGGGIYSYGGANNVGLRNFVTDLVNSTTATPTKSYSSFSQAVDPITGDGRGNFSTNDVNLYFQDSWKWKPNLTLSAGIRYEVQYMPSVQAGNPLIPANQTLNTDTNNFGPRLGFAWSPGGSGKTVIRGGGGVYFGRTQNSTIFVHMFQNGVFQKSFSFAPANCGSPLFPNTVFPQPSTAPAFGPIFGTSGPVPSATFANFAAFQTACAASGGATPTVSTMSPNFANPMVYQYDVAYEREFPWQLVGSVSFVGARGNRLPVFLDENLPAASSTRTYFVLDGASRPTGPVSFTLPFYVLSAATPRPLKAAGYNVPLMVDESVVNSWYRGVVVRAKRKLSHGFTFDANYTWSIARDNGQVAGVNGTFTGTVSPLDSQNLRGEYGLSEIDIRNRFVANIVWNMPWGNMVDGKELKGILKDWQAATVWRLQDGRPIAAAMAGRPTCPTIAGDTADGGLTCGSVSGTGGAINGRVPFFARNSLFTSPGIETFDLRLSRKFRITERVDFEFLWEAFNIFNHTNYVPSSGVFGVNNSMFDFVSSGGTITAASGGNPAIICNTSSAPASALPAGAIFGGCLVKREFPRLATTSAFLSPVSTSNTLYTARQMQFGAKVHF